MRGILHPTYTLLLASICWVALFSCNKIFDNLSDCPTAFKIRFSYQYQGQDVLKEKIQTVRLYIFNEQNVLVHTFDVSAADYAANSVPVRLATGKYKVLAVGNLSASSKVAPDVQVGKTVMADFYLNHPWLQDASKKIPANDPVYLGQQPITVPAFEQAPTELVYTVPFVKAHTELQVFVKGLPVLPDGHPIPAVVEIKGITPTLNFTGETTGGIVSHYPTGAKGADDDYVFNTVFFNRSPEHMMIVLKDRDGNILYEKKVTDYLAENNIPWDTQKENKLQIVLGWYRQTWIGVTIERWKEITVTPVYQ